MKLSPAIFTGGDGEGLEADKVPRGSDEDLLPSFSSPFRPGTIIFKKIRLLSMELDVSHWLQTVID